MASVSIAASSIVFTSSASGRGPTVQLTTSRHGLRVKPAMTVGEGATYFVAACAYAACARGCSHAFLEVFDCGSRPQGPRASSRRPDLHSPGMLAPGFSPSRSASSTAHGFRFWRRSPNSIVSNFYPAQPIHSYPETFSRRARVDGICRPSRKEHL